LSADVTMPAAKGKRRAALDASYRCREKLCRATHLSALGWPAARVHTSPRALAPVQALSVPGSNEHTRIPRRSNGDEQRYAAVSAGSALRSDRRVSPICPAVSAGQWTLYLWTKVSLSARHRDLYVCFENTKQADIDVGPRILQHRTVEEPENVRGNHNER